MPLTKITDPQYHDLLVETAKEFNKRMGWVTEMKKSKKYPGFLTDKGKIDLRDIYSMSSLLPLRGETEEEQKKNFQDDVYKMENALVNGPEEETKKYINMVFDSLENFDDSKMDYTKKEDVFRAISFGALNQCYGTKKSEFKQFFKEKYNTPELKEKFYYANNANSKVSYEIFSEVNKYVHLDISVTILGLNMPVSDVQKRNQENSLQRDAKQYEAIKAGKDGIVPLEFEIPEVFNKANDANLDIVKLNNETEIALPIQLVFSESYLPGGTDGKDDVEYACLSLTDAIFINGKPLKEDIKNSPIDHMNSNSYQQNLQAQFVKRMTEPETMIEYAKIIPLEGGGYKVNYVPVHRNFTHINPQLQEAHDKAFNEFAKVGYAKNRKQEDAYLESRYGKIADRKKAIDIKRNVSYDPKLVGQGPTWENYDHFLNSNNVNGMKETLKTSYGIVNNFPDALKKYDPNFNPAKMSIINKRQGGAIALMLAGKDAAKDEIMYQRYRVHNALTNGGEEEKQIFKELANAIRNYDLEKVNYNGSRHDLYYQMVFAQAVTALTNIFQENPDFEEEMMSDRSFCEDFANKTTFSLIGSEFFGSKYVEAVGQIPENSVTHVNLRQEELLECESLYCVETKRLGYDIAMAKIGACNSNKTEANLTIPYFFAGGACGGNIKDFSTKSISYTFSDYLAALNFHDQIFDFGNNNVKQASIKELQLGTAASFFNTLQSSYNPGRKSVSTDFISVSGINNVDLTEQCVYINGKSLKNLIEVKMQKVAAQYNLQFDQMDKKDVNNYREGIKTCLIAEALSNPKKSISQIILHYNEKNEVEPKVVHLNKDYSKVYQKASTQHTWVGKIFHAIHFYTYAEEKMMNYVKEANATYNSSNKNTEILENFKTENAAEILKYNAEYCYDRAKRREYLAQVNPEKVNELDLQDHKIKDIAKEFAEPIEKDSQFTDNTTLKSRPKLDKVSKISVDVRGGNYADSIETDNFKRELKEQSKDEYEDLDVGSYSEKEENVADISDDFEIKN